MPSRTTPPKWRRAFLRALSTTANVTLSAHHAAIDKTTAYETRRCSPLFARLWDQALTDARAAIAEGRVPEAAAEMTRRPLSIRSGKSGRTCVMKTGEGRWNEDVEERFFDHLAATANVKSAAQAIGMSTTALYNRRRQWHAFDALWEDTVRLATNRLNLHLIEAASNMLDPPDVAVPDLEPVSIDQAIRIVQMNKDKTRANGDRKRHGWRRAPTDIEAVKAEIIRKARLLSGLPPQ